MDPVTVYVLHGVSTGTGNCPCIAWCWIVGPVIVYVLRDGIHIVVPVTVYYCKVVGNGPMTVYVLHGGR